MSLWRQLSHGLRVLTHRRAADEDVADEVQHFLDQAAAESVTRGLSPEEARRAAKLEVGNMDAVREQIREAGWENLLESFLADLRFALRLLRNSPGFALVAVLTLALGIGANTAIFGLIDAMLLRPLPFTESDRLVSMWTMLPRWGREVASGPDFQDWRKSAALEDAAAVSRTSMNLGDVTEPERLIAGRATASLLPVLKLHPIIGRNFAPAEDQPGGPNVVLLGRALWLRQFGGRTDILGKAIQLNAVPYEVIGVVPTEINIIAAADVWIPQALRSDLPRRGDFLRVIGRLRPGFTVEQAQAQLATLAHQLSDQYPDTNKDVGIGTADLHADLVHNARPMLLSLWIAVGFVLLIVVANVANLLLARAATRKKEVAIRVALGAKPARLLRQLLTESLVLAFIGGGLGIGLAYWALGAALKFLPWKLPEGVSVQISGLTLAFAAGVTLGAGILFGMVPGIQAVRSSVFSFLKDGRRTSQAGHQSTRRGLVSAEIAIALLLLVGAGLMIRTVQRLRQVDPGFRGNGLLTFRVTLPPEQYSEQKQVIYYNQLLSRLAALPSVQSVGATSDLYFESGNYFSFQIQGHPPKRGEEPDAYSSAVTSAYAQTMGVRLIRGRFFTDADRENSAKVAVINEKLAKQYFGWQDPIGQHVGFDTDKGVTVWREVVGVIGDVHQETLDKAPYAEMIVPLAQSPQPAIAIVIRTSARPELLVPAVRHEVQAIDANVPMYNVRTMDEITSESLLDRNFQTWILGAFAALALLVAAIGIYGVMALAVTQRIWEFGIRMALGAQPSQILSLVLGSALRLVAVGLGIGLLGSLALARFLTAFLFGVSAHDPSTMLFVAVLLGLVALLACYVPAFRAMRVDPIVALRYE